MTYNIGVDHGNKQIKTRSTIFVAGVTKSTYMPVMSQEYIKTGDTFYVLTNERIPYMRDKTVDERYFILTLFAIAREIKTRGIEERTLEVNLGVGLPPEHLSTISEKFKAYFNTGGDYIHFEYETELFAVKICNVGVFPQGFAAVYETLKAQAKDYPTMYLIDMGGYTVDVLEFNSGKVNFERCQSKEKGVIQMYNQIVRALRSEDILVTENEIDAILKNNMTGIYLPASAVQMIKDKAQAYIEDLLYTLREEGYDIKNKYTFFVGGGALLMRVLLEKSKFVGSHQILNNISANAIGYENLMFLLNNKKVG